MSSHDFSFWKNNCFNRTYPHRTWMCTDLPIHYSLNPRTFWCGQISVDYWSTDGVCYIGTCLMPPFFGIIARSIGITLFPIYLGVFLCIMFFMYETVIKNSYSIVFSYHITINKKEPVGTLKKPQNSVPTGSKYNSLPDSRY